MAISRFRSVRSAGGRRNDPPRREPTALSSYAAQASYMAVSATASVREWIVGRAPARSTSRAVASSEISSHLYAAVGLKPGSGLAWTRTGAAPAVNERHVNQRTEARTFLDMMKK